MVKEEGMKFKKWCEKQAEADLASTRAELAECKTQLAAADKGLLSPSDPKSRWQGISKECKLWEERAIKAETALESLRGKVRELLGFFPYISTYQATNPDHRAWELMADLRSDVDKGKPVEYHSEISGYVKGDGWEKEPCVDCMPAYAAQLDKCPTCGRKTRASVESDVIICEGCKRDKNYCMCDAFK